MTRQCSSCGYFIIGTDGGSTFRDGKTFGICDRSGRPGSMTQPVRWDEPAGLCGVRGAVGPRGDGVPYTAKELAAHEEERKKPVYGTAYHNRTTLYVLPEFCCAEYLIRQSG